MTTLLACAACYGQSDSAMAAGMNWGILSLLTVIVFVLGGVAGFSVFLARRASSIPGPAVAPALLPREERLSDLKTPTKFNSSPAYRGIKPPLAPPQRRSACSTIKSGQRGQ